MWLYLDSNALQKIDPGVFAGLTSLEGLNLGSNTLQEIEV